VRPAPCLMINDFDSTGRLNWLCGGRPLHGMLKLHFRDRRLFISSLDEFHRHRHLHLLIRGHATSRVATVTNHDHERETSVAYRRRLQTTAEERLLIVQRLAC